MKAGFFDFGVFAKDHDYSCIPVLFEVDDALCGDVFRHKGKTYVASMINKAAGFVGIKEINVDPECTAKEYERNLICPFCGYEDRDSWELSESSDEHECGRCGALLSYSRHVTVEYSSHLIKAPTIRDI